MLAILFGWLLAIVACVGAVKGFVEARHPAKPVSIHYCSRSSTDALCVTALERYTRVHSALTAATETELHDDHPPAPR